MQGASQHLGGSPHLGALLSLSPFRTRRARRSLQVEEEGVQAVVSSQAHLPPPKRPPGTHTHTCTHTHTHTRVHTHTITEADSPPSAKLSSCYTHTHTHTHLCKFRHNHRG